jgi:hypothetical protein
MVNFAGASRVGNPVAVLLGGDDYCATVGPCLVASERSLEELVALLEKDWEPGLNEDVVLWCGNRAVQLWCNDGRRVNLA